MLVDLLRNDRAWEDFLQNRPQGTFYHSLKWRDVIRKSFPCDALYLTIKAKGGKLVGICPGFTMTGLMHMKVFLSMPYSDYGGPAIEDYCVTQASMSLRNFLQSICSEKGIGYARIRFSDSKLSLPFKSSSSYVDKSIGSMEIDLETMSSDLIWSKIFSKNRRSKIRRFERDGYQAYEAQTKSDLITFYGLYADSMRHISVSPYPYEFVENMWIILHPENLRIWLVGKKETIGGILVFKHQQKTYWVYAGIDREKCRNLYSVIPYLIWQEIKTAEEEGYRCVSLGPTSIDPYSTYHLQKKDFGCSFNQQETLWYPINSAGRILIKTGAKAILSWKAMRKFLPDDLRGFLEDSLLPRL